MQLDVQLLSGCMQMRKEEFLFIDENYVELIFFLNCFLLLFFLLQVYFKMLIIKKVESGNFFDLLSQCYYLLHF